MSSQLTKILKRIAAHGFRHQEISFFDTSAPNQPKEHRKHGLFGATCAGVFGYGDSPESAIDDAAKSAIDIQARGLAACKDAS